MKQFNLRHFSNYVYAVAMAVTSLWRKKMRAGITLLFLLTLNMANGQNISLDWAKSMGGPEGDIPFSVIIDAAGCSYIGGIFAGTADFDPGPNTVNLVSQGNNDIFIAKYDANGNYIWAHGIGSTGGDALNGLVIDASGYIYATGSFSGTVDFNPAGAVANLSSNGNSDMFIAKFDTAGNYIWAKNAGGTGADDGADVTIDQSGNVHVTGSYSGTLYFGPTGSPNSLTAPSGQDCFFAKYDASGNYVWSKSIGGSGMDGVRDIKTDAVGNIYVTGRYEGSTDINPGPATANFSSNGNTDFYVGKYTPAGDYIWGFSIGGIGHDEPGNMILDDATGSIWITGFFNGTVDFNPGAGVAQLIATSMNNQDGFIAKYDTGGNYIIAKNIGGGSQMGIGASALNTVGELYISGSFGGTVDFDPGTSVASHTSAGLISDAYLAKYDANINYLWSGTMGSALGLLTGGACMASAGNDIYVSGLYMGMTDLDPGPGSAEFSSVAGGIDIFLLKFVDGCPSLSSFSHTACDSFTFNGTTYTATGIYKDTFTSILYGCDSIVTIDLTVNHSTINPVVTGTYCDSVTFNGVTYNTTGVYTQQYFSFNGCDSNITYDITIKGQTNNSQLTETACDAYFINNTSYTVSGMYLVTMTNADGCDSIIMLDLTVNPAPEATVIKSGSILTVNSADSYQWINCADNSVIPGATDQSYTATAGGSYAVVITDNGCSDTSGCVQTEGVGINNPDAGNMAWLYPNPVDGHVNIQTGQPLTHATIRLVSITGRVLQEHTNQQGSLFLINMEAYAGGIYFIEITEAGSTTRMRVVKE